jgi:hypothetical protein
VSSKVSPIAIHFAQLLDEREQDRIGVTDSLNDSMRVMRLLSAYDELRRCAAKDQEANRYCVAEIDRLRADNAELRAKYRPFELGESYLLRERAEKSEANNARLRKAMKRALPILEEHASDESVFWGGPEHQIAKEAVETYEQARAALAEGIKR